MTDSLKMFLDVLALIGNSTWSDDRILEDLEADLAANIVRYFPFAPSVVDLVKHIVQFGGVVFLKEIDCLANLFGNECSWVLVV